MTDRMQFILELPTNLDKVHESAFKAYHLLDYVLELIERGVDKETIKEIVKHIRQYRYERKRKTN